MNTRPIDFVTMSDKCLQLFRETKEVFLQSEKEEIKRMSGNVPSTFVDENKSINVVFAGQYSAGKSTIISIMTGEQLEIGQGVTTNQVHSFEWQGIKITDTPGVHTQKRPDHDEITYRAIAEADLIVFVVTGEGFSDHLGKHFRKLLVDKGKGREMMLVVNKMESTELGNTPEQQRIFTEKNLLPVISPEFAADDLYVCFVDAQKYEEAMEESDPDEKAWLFEQSGFDNFYETLNRFVKDKNFLGRCTTSLYENEQVITDALAKYDTGDFCVDGAMNILSKQRRLLADSQENIKNQTYNLVRRHTQQIIQWGDDIANGLSSKDKEREVNERLKEKYDLVNALPEKISEEIEVIIAQENERLKEQIEDMENSNFVRDYRKVVDEMFSEINVNSNGGTSFQSGAKRVSDFGVWLSKQSTGPDAASGWASIFKLGTYSGSKTHEFVLGVGHFFGHKFRPWEAVKIAGKIGKVGKFLGVAGAFVGIVAQISSDRREIKIENQLAENRTDIRNTFRSTANAINLEFDENTQTWVETNYGVKISEIDRNLDELRLMVDAQNHEMEKIQSLLIRNRDLIKQIHGYD